MDKARITIVFGTYKQPELIRSSIDAILNSSLKNYIIYVVDDNSPDDFVTIDKTKKIIKDYDDCRIIYIKNEINIGVPYVFKKWIDLVETPYFLIFGAGDTLQPTALEKMVLFLDNNPLASFVYGHEYFEDSASGRREINKVKLETGIYEPKKYLEYHLIGGKEIYGWSQASAMYRTELFKYYNIPVKTYHFWDHYFHCSYLVHSKKVGHINEYLAARHVDTSLGFWANNNQFTDRLERLIQSTEFISEYETMLIQKKYPLTKYRLIISAKLFKGLFFCQNFNEFQITFRKATAELLRYFFSVFFYILGKPIIKLVNLVLTNRSHVQNS